MFQAIKLLLGVKRTDEAPMLVNPSAERNLLTDLSTGGRSEQNFCKIALHAHYTTTSRRRANIDH